MGNVLEVRVVADEEVPRSGWVSVEDLVGRLGLADARARLKDVQSGKIVQLGGAGTGELVMISCPLSRREDLAAEIDSTLRAAITPEQLKELPLAERQALAQTSSEPNVLAVLAADRRSVQTRRNVAANRGCPPQLLFLLSHDTDPGVRCCVAHNPAADELTLHGLAPDLDDLGGVFHGVGHALTTNPSCPSDVLQGMLLTLSAADVTTVREWTFAQTSAAVLDNPGLDEDFAQTIIDAWWATGKLWQRKALARVTRTGRVRLLELAADPKVGFDAERTLQRLGR